MEVLTVDSKTDDEHTVIQTLGVTQELQWMRYSSHVKL